MTAPQGRGPAESGGISSADGAFRILHVSTGNVCRSPIAERLTRHALRRQAR